MSSAPIIARNIAALLLLFGAYMGTNTRRRRSALC